MNRPRASSCASGLLVYLVLCFFLVFVGLFLCVCVFVWFFGGLGVWGVGFRDLGIGFRDQGLRAWFCFFGQGSGYQGFGF